MMSVSVRYAMKAGHSCIAFSFCLLLVFRATSVAQGGAQTHTSTAAPPSTLTRPDSIQDSGFYNYCANMSEQGRAGGRRRASPLATHAGVRRLQGLCGELHSNRSAGKVRNHFY